MSDTETGADGATPTTLTPSEAAPDQQVDGPGEATPVRRPRTRAATSRTTKKAAAPPANEGGSDAAAPPADEGSSDAAVTPVNEGGTDAAGTPVNEGLSEAAAGSDVAGSAGEPADAAAPTAKKATRKRTTKKTAAAADPFVQPALSDDDAAGSADPAPPARKRASRRATPVTSPFTAVTEPAADAAPDIAAADTAAGAASADTSSDVPATRRAPSRTRRAPTRASTDLFVSPVEAPPPAQQPEPVVVDTPPDDTTADGATPPRQRRRRTSAAVPLFQAPTETSAPAATADEQQAPADTADAESSRAARSTRSRSRSRTAATSASRDAASQDAAPDEDLVALGSAQSDGSADAQDASATDIEPLEADALHTDTVDGDVAIDAIDDDSTDDDAEDDEDDDEADAGAETSDTADVEETAEGTTTRRRRRRGGRGRRRKPAGEDSAAEGSADATDDGTAVGVQNAESTDDGAEGASGMGDEPGDPSAPTTSRSSRSRSRSRNSSSQQADVSQPVDGSTAETASVDGGDTSDPTSATDQSADADTAGDSTTDQPRTSSSSRRRRSRRRAGESTDAPAPDDPPLTVVRVREPRPTTDDDVTSLKGSTRLEAKKQRRRDGRDQGRRRSPVITEAEFLARRESVDRVMLVRQSGSRTQIAVLEDGVLVEHYVAHASQTSSVGNVYLGKVQNVLPAMEAAFIDIGKGRNAVLYAGEVAWSRMGLDGKARRMESVLSSGQSILVQVTKDPVGSKGARLTGLVSLPGRFLVYAPGGSMSGISRKLPEKERARLKAIVKKVFPDEASVIIRTAAEGASEEELSEDIHRLEAQWLDIEAKAATASAPAPLYAEPDLAIKVVRDMFNEDFASLVVSGGEAWETLQPYVAQVAPDLVDRLSRWTAEADLFAEYRVDEQIAKALDRKVWLPSGGSLVIDRTEAMTVVDVNTGKFTGSGGNLEATVTKNNLEAAEEIVRQIRLRDIGGIIVIDFIDMVLENNRDLVLRRLVECLGRDRTRHQVAEVTSLGLVQMTRKRVGQGLLDVFSEPCEHCNGRGVRIYYEPVESIGGDPHEQTPQPARGQTESGRSGRSRRGTPAAPPVQVDGPPQPRPADLIRAVAMAAINSRTAVVEPDSDGQAAADPAESLDPAETLEVFDVADESSLDGDLEAESAAELSSEDPVDADPVMEEVDPAPENRSRDGGDQQHEITLDAPDDHAAAEDDPQELDTESPESGHAPARRGRRTRSTRRPAGPPRPVSSSAVDVPGIITASELPAVAASVAAPAGASNNSGEPSSTTDDADSGSFRIAGDSSPRRDADSPGVEQAADNGGEPRVDADRTAAVSSDEPVGRTPRRRRATRPAGAPTT